MFFQPKLLIINKRYDPEVVINNFLLEENLTTDKTNITYYTSEKQSIGINIIAKLNIKISSKRSELSISVIPFAEKLTEEAQNSLLKTLEEPNENSLIILLTNNPEGILPTIKSRVIQSNILNSEIEEVEPIFQEFLNANYIERKKIIEKILEMDNHRQFALDLILYIINFIKTDRPELGDKFIEIYLSTKQNGNLKLALESLNILLT